MVLPVSNPTGLDYGAQFSALPYNLQLLHDGIMVDLVINDISEHLVSALRERAVKDGKTTEDLARSILTAVARHWVVQKMPTIAEMTVVKASRFQKEKESEQIFTLAEKQPVRIIDKKGSEFVLMAARDFHLLGGLDADGDA